MAPLGGSNLSARVGKHQLLLVAASRSSQQVSTYLSGDMIIEHSGPPNKINLIPKSFFRKFEVKTRLKNK